MNDASLPKAIYHGVPPEDGARLGLLGPVRYVLTIENYASFVRHVREVNAAHDGLVIYTGGFPARPILKQIVRLAKLAAAPAFHWGDIDPGGVRIFRHLEDTLAAQGIRLAPHLMNGDILYAFGVAAKAGQRTVRSGAAGQSAIADTWDAIAETGLILEQETLAPEAPCLQC